MIKGEKLTVLEKFTLDNALTEMNSVLAAIQNKPETVIRAILKNEQALNAIKTQGFETDMKIIETLPHNDKVITAMNYVSNLNVSLTIPKSPYNQIYHEAGHILDNKSRYATYHFDSYDRYPDSLKQWVNNKENIETAREVSEYAATGQGEFIAETFAGLVDGRKFSQKVLDLYEKSGGPKFPE